MRPNGKRTLPCVYCSRIADHVNQNGSMVCESCGKTGYRLKA